MWKKRLMNAGFTRVMVLGRGTNGRELSQRVIVAELSPQTASLATPNDSLAYLSEEHGLQEKIEEKTVVQDNQEGIGEKENTTHLPDSGLSMEEYLVDEIVNATAACLNMPRDEINLDRAFSSFGVDSIIGVELINRINQALDIVLKTIVIFDHPSVRQLAAYISQTYKNDLRVPTTQHSDSLPITPPNDETVGKDVRSLQNIVEDYIVECMSQVLMMQAEEIDRQRAFSSVGVDSIVGVELINKLNEKLGIVLKTITIFDHPTVADLAGFITSRYAGKVAVDALEVPAPPSSDNKASTPEYAQVKSEEFGSAAAKTNASTTYSEAQEPVLSENNPVLHTQQVSHGGFRAVRFERPGSPKNLRIHSIEPSEPQAGEVEILVKAFPINFSDFLLAKGLYPIMPDFPFTPGVEVSGVIRKIGSGVSRVTVGDEVIALSRPEMGGQASVVVTDENFVVKKPRNVSHEEACGFPVAFLAMYLAFERAQVKKGERILIQAATGTNGLMAVQLAQLVGAEIFATVGSNRKVEFLKRMGIENTINHREVDFADEILRRTAGEGVDIVINTVSGETLQKGLDILAPEGRYVEIAVFGLQASKSVNLSRLIDNQSFYSFNTKKFFLKHPEERIRYLETMASYLGSGKIKPTIAQVFPFDRVVDAYDLKENRETIGRVVVSLAENTLSAPAEASQYIPATEHNHSMDIAIVGVSGRFPGADNVDQLWENLAKGIDATREVPRSRWANSRYFDEDPTILDKTYCKRGGFLDQIDKFDAAFFNISGKEAEQTDPQQRLFLEEAWKALEDAGYTSKMLDGKRCGVFVGVGPGDYLTRMNKAAVKKEAQSFWGNEVSVLAARISYFLNLKGPSIAINTACSSSLVALHLACQNILSGECELAISGGVFLSTAPDYFIVASNGNMLSPEGRCKTFDDSADGFGPGEAVGVVVLKPLQRALAEGDFIHGVIKGSAINQDGKTNGITAPSSLAQTEVELAVYDRFGIHPETIGCIEAHGTGTKLGDPIEIEALNNAFRKYTQKKQYCPIGSVKTNIGHTAAAAGISGVVKLLLSLKHRQIPASLNFNKQNEHIDFENSPFFVNTRLRDWDCDALVPRRAAISSFGFSGTNAHLVLEEAPPVQRRAMPVRSEYFIPVSAASQSALKRKLEQIYYWLQGEGSRYSLSDISYNLQVRRDHFSERVGFMARDKDDLLRQLSLALDSSNSGINQEGTDVTGRCRESMTRYLEGRDIDWIALNDGAISTNIPMPTYPFDKVRYWFMDNDTIYTDELQSAGIKYQSCASDTNQHQRCLQTTFTGNEFFLQDHRVDGKRILPGVLCFELTRKAAEAGGLWPCVIRDLFWLDPLSVDEQAVDLHTTLRYTDSGYHFELRSCVKESDWVAHARGVLLPTDSSPILQRISLNKILASCPRTLSADEHYTKLRALGLEHGPTLCAVENVQVGDGRALGRLRLPSEVEETLDGFSFPPSLLDGALQVLVALTGQVGGGIAELLLPFFVEEVILCGKLPVECYSYVEAIPNTASQHMQSYHIQLIDENGQVLLMLKNLSIKTRSGKNASSPRETSDLLEILKKLENGEIGEEDVLRVMDGNYLWGNQ
jgi:acyl transferase domain-containing protein/NADPH:quinone reductase-like Zn-dependent oxidoreductase/acyl carrier protein